jgi:hypothetical protein
MVGTRQRYGIVHGATLLCILLFACLACPFATAACSTDTDCARNLCCQATGCVEASAAPDCSVVLCAAVCSSNTLDCGQGRCVCHAGACAVEWNSNSPAPTSSPPDARDQCALDSECIPADCCHASRCISIRRSPTCTDAACTEECRAGTLDCGYGACACLRGRCGVRWTSTSLPSPGGSSSSPGSPGAPPPVCASDNDCVANACCHPSDCIHASLEPNCTGVACTLECRGGTMDCNQGKCACTNGRCGVRWEPTSTLPSLTNPPDERCTSNADCGPADCCHSRACVHVSRVPRCFAACTAAMGCHRGTMDCGQGDCECTRGRCAVRWTPAPSNSPTVLAPKPSDDTCATNAECVPATCCASTSCVNRSHAPDCSAVLCAAICEAGSTNCGQGECRCTSGVCTAHFFAGAGTGGSSGPAGSTTSPGETSASADVQLTAEEDAAQSSNCSVGGDCAPANCCDSTVCVHHSAAPDCAAVQCVAQPRRASCMCINSRCVAASVDSNGDSSVASGPLSVLTAFLLALGVLFLFGLFAV